MKKSLLNGIKLQKEATTPEQVREVACAILEKLPTGRARPPKTPRDHLVEHDQAVRQIELVEVAIRILENLHGPRVDRATKILRQDQQESLKLIDATAEKLGAPYPGKKRL